MSMKYFFIQKLYKTNIVMFFHFENIFLECGKLR